MTSSPLMFIGAALIALFVGFLTGLFGVGGGFLMSPALMLLGFPAPIAVGTDVATILFNSAFGILKRRGSGTVDHKLALTLASGSVIGVLIGGLLLEALKKLPPLVIMGTEQVAVQYVLFIVFLFILVFLAVFLKLDAMTNQQKTEEKHIGLFAGLRVAPRIHFDSLEGVSLPLLPLIILGLGIGVLTGLLGIGGGVLLLPALIFLVGQRASRAVGTSLMLVFISSFIAVIFHFSHGNISLKLLGLMVAGGLVGTYIGTHIGLKTKDTKLRAYFAYVVMAAALLVAWKIYAMTFPAANTH